MIEAKNCVFIPVVIINCKCLNFSKLEISGYTKLKFV
jgi:hypothetical protein